MKSLKGPSLNNIIADCQAFVKDKFQSPAIASPYTHIVIFGDELSDAGRWGEYTNMRFPPSRYGFYKGRWCNGKVWVELLAEQLGISRSRTENYALAGATTGLYNVFKPLRMALEQDRKVPIDGMLSQVDRYLKNNPRISKHTLFVLLSGINDVRSYLVNEKPDIVHELPSANVESAIKHLCDAGATEFVVGNCPDLSLTNEYLNNPEHQVVASYCRDFNIGISNIVQEYEGSNVHVKFFDLCALFNQVYNDPESFGFAYHDAYLPLEIINFANPLETPAIDYPHHENGLLPDQLTYCWSVCPSAPLPKVMLCDVVKIFTQDV